jgi:hypothetical protein
MAHPYLAADTRTRRGFRAWDLGGGSQTLTKKSSNSIFSRASHLQQFIGGDAHMGQKSGA